MQRDEKLHAGDGGKVLMDDKMISRTLMQFFLDGYDPLSTVVTQCFYNLAVNPEVQAAAYAEVEAMVEEKGGLDTSAVSELKYLDSVFQETLRVLAFPYTMRRCNKPWTIPGSDITIPVGTRVMINIGGLHMDPEFWDEPKAFRPERFSPEVRDCASASEISGLMFTVFFRTRARLSPEPTCLSEWVPDSASGCRSPRSRPRCSCLRS